MREFISKVIGSEFRQAAKRLAELKNLAKEGKLTPELEQELKTLKAQVPKLQREVSSARKKALVGAALGYTGYELEWKPRERLAQSGVPLSMQIAKMSSEFPVRNAAEREAAIRYFERNKDMMTPIEKRAYCKVIASQTDVPEEMAKYATDSVNPDLAYEIHNRLLYLNEEDAAKYEMILDKAAEEGPEMLAYAMQQLDYKLGLNRLWGRHISDPVQAVFKEAQDTISLVRGMTIKLLKSHREQLKQKFGEEFVKALESDPESTFASLPPQMQLELKQMADNVYEPENTPFSS